MSHALGGTTGPALVRLRMLVSIAVLATVIGVGWHTPAEALLQCYGRVVTISGGPGGEVIDASMGVTDGPDVIHGGGGDDEIYGLGGDDVICGGEGHDIVDGGDGRDKIAGNRGDDLVDGGRGDDRLAGFDGNDVLRGGPDDDQVEGGDGYDFARDWGDDTVWGNDGDDLIRGSGGDDELNGGPVPLEDARDGYGGNDILYAFGGNDRISDRAMFDQAFGGEGDDYLFMYDEPAFPVGDFVYGDAGTDRCVVNTNDHDSNACEIWQPA